MMLAVAEQGASPALCGKQERRTNNEKENL